MFFVRRIILEIFETPSHISVSWVSENSSSFFLSVVGLCWSPSLLRFLGVFPRLHRELPVKYRIEFKILFFTHKALKNQGPAYIWPHIQPTRLSGPLIRVFSPFGALEQLHPGH